MSRPISLAMAALLLAVSVAHAATIRVPDDQPTIQAGIDAAAEAAAEGDTVLVAPGTYTGPGNVDLDFYGTDLVLMSEAGAAVTIIDCGGTACGICVNGGQGPSSVIQGLTIRNGQTWAQGGSGRWFCDGAGMYIGPSCAPTIRDCHFQDCIAVAFVLDMWGMPVYMGSGGGLACEGSATITGCTFSGNVAFEQGGGMYCEGSPVLTDCEFYGNSTVGYGAGGGMTCGQGSTTLTDCVFFGNGGSGMCCVLGSTMLTSCRFEGNDGSGASCFSGKLTLTDCLVSGNSSCGAFCSSGDLALTGCTITGNGLGGVCLRAQLNSVDALLMNCTISGNSCAPDGGAVSCNGVNYPVSLTLSDCIVASNTAGCAILCTGAFTEPALSCCDIYGNPGGDWIGCIAGQYGVNSNFSDDPLFCLEDNPGEPYSLHEGSPCLPENSPCGELVGAVDQGCGAVTVVEAVSWGAIKAMYR